MIEMQGIMNVGNWLLKKVAPILQSDKREKFLRDKNNHEKLVSALIASVACFRTRRVHIPGFLTKQDDSIDCGVVDSTGNGAAIQVTSTWNDPNQQLNLNITDLVQERIEEKHKQGKRYCEKNHLCVFIGQQEYDDLNMNKLNQWIQTAHLFTNYWAIAPHGESYQCRFIVCELWSEGNSQQYQCVVDFTPPNQIQMNYLGNILKGKKLINLVDFLKSDRLGQQLK